MIKISKAVNKLNMILLSQQFSNTWVTMSITKKTTKNLTLDDASKAESPKYKEDDLKNTILDFSLQLALRTRTSTSTNTQMYIFLRDRWPQ